MHILGSTGAFQSALSLSGLPLERGQLADSFWNCIVPSIVCNYPFENRALFSFIHYLHRALQSAFTAALQIVAELNVYYE